MNARSGAEPQTAFSDGVLGIGRTAHDVPSKCTAAGMLPAPTIRMSPVTPPMSVVVVNSSASGCAVQVPAWRRYVEGEANTSPPARARTWMLLLSCGSGVIGAWFQLLPSQCTGFCPEVVVSEIQMSVEDRAEIEYVGPGTSGNGVHWVPVQRQNAQLLELFAATQAVVEAHP